MHHFIKFKIAIFFIAIIVFAVILISWGLVDIDGFLAHPARMMLLFLLLIQFIIFEFIPWGWILSRLPAPPSDDNKLIAVIGAMGILLFLMISPFSDRNEWMQLGGGNILRYCGVFFFTLGCIIANWASIHLYQQLVIQYHRNQHGYQLVTTGPFEYVRHPRDFGVILIFVSIPLIFLSSLGLFLALFSIVGLFERIAREEQILRQEFGDEWLDYVEKTKCLVPWV